jgi:hypothetical protein
MKTPTPNAPNGVEYLVASPASQQPRWMFVAYCNEEEKLFVTIDPIRPDTDAASELFAALANLGEHARPDNWDDDDDPELRDAWRQADADIAKATSR